ncbi:sodium/glutamate symporter [Rhizobium sp. YJ-22]|jgi:ESS family glutamate:Na+ symporter|uniref:sodium/glutamate symporter n=2 Tax=Rhizobiaceae TaxID=82115 RepID=UPI0024129B79|nr:sodium/glutamate symporter [Rhizobium sp. YJ-22]MDG3579796.1 sodium/glutamate symporter [Rhizobium sp. YJ-22]
MIQVSPFLSFTIAVLLLIVGKILTMNIAVLRKYSIPEPVVGGILCASLVALAYWIAGWRIQFELGMRDYLLLLFFASIGLKSDAATLLQGGRPLVVLLALATTFMLIQNATGMGIAALFGLDPKAGLMVGSVSLTGGVGTTVAWAPIFVGDLGIANAMELGIASNTVGLIAACVIGGPMAALLIRRNRIVTSGDADLDIGAAHEEPEPKMDYFCLLWAILALNVAVMLGMALDSLIALTGFRLPAFVSCLLAGIAIRNLMPLAAGAAITRVWPGVRQGLSLLSDLTLGLFLTMALMGLQLWQLSGVFTFVVAALVVQVALTIVYTVFIVFPAMGRDYEAAVISASFGGITLGSTATAIANMTAVTQQYGAAHRAFIIVPLVCGFFIDLVNAVVIAMFAQ